MKSHNNIRSMGSTEHKINFLDQIEQQFIMQEYHQNHFLQYNHLLNQLLHHNHHKKNKKDYLQKILNENHGLCFNQITKNSNSTSRLVTKMNNEKEELQICEKRISEQYQIKNHLLKDINQITKSINLLKSDVGRVINKTQSTTILEKKTNKAKIIVNDQLKKVNLALHKDHAEINQTNNLQIKFNNKLKNICNNQNLSLFRIKQNFAKIKQREQHIYKKIHQRSKIMKNLNERQKIKEVIKIVSENNRLKLQQLLNMVGFVKDISKQQHKYLEIDDNEQFCGFDEGSDSTPKESQTVYSQNIDKYLYLRIQSFKSKIKQIQNYLVKFVSLINNTLNRNNWLYEDNLHKITEHQERLLQLHQEYHHKQQQIYNDSHAYHIDLNSYHLKYKDFKQKIKVILGFWCFIQNNYIITQQITNQKENEVKTRAKNVNKLAKRQSSDLVAPYFTYQQNYYMNQLYNLTLYLGNIVEQYELQQNYLLQQVELYISKWLKGFKEIILKAHNPNTKRLKSLQTLHFKSTMELQQQEQFHRQSNHTKFRISQVSNSDTSLDKFKLMLSLFNKKSKFCQQNEEKYGKRINSKQIAKTEGNECVSPPQRIKYIKKIENQHYKLLKNVLKCEKQNNLKDYIFKKQFTRKKYDQKDIVQQEKRYQANFAFQMNPKKIINHSSQRFGEYRLKTLNLENNNNRRSMNGIQLNLKTCKRQPSNHKTESFSRYSLINQDQCNLMFLNGPKLPFNAQKLNRKSKMLEKNLESDRLSSHKVHSKISFVEGDPQQFYCAI